MKLLPFILLYIFCMSSTADELKSKPIFRYEVNEGDLLIIPTDMYLVLLLSDYEDETTIDRLQLNSKYGAPTFKFRDVMKSEDPQILVETTSGGTGLSTKELTIITISNGKFKKSGSFHLDYHEVPTDYIEVFIKADVKFNSEGELIYSWQKTGYYNQKNLAEHGSEIYVLNNGVYIRKNPLKSTTACEGVELGCDFLECCKG